MKFCILEIPAFDTHTSRRPCSRDDRFDEGLAGLRIGDVEGVGLGILDCTGRLDRAGDVDVSHDDVMAVSRELVRDGRSYARTGAGDDGDRCGHDVLLAMS